MKYNTAVKAERREAMSYFMKLANKKCLVEVKKLSPRRTMPQNNYLHLILTDFGLHFGWTLDEAKTFYKRQVNPTLYVYEKNGIKFLRSSADLDRAEMAKSIDQLMQFSAEQGHPLPPAEDQEWLRWIANEAEKVQYYAR